ncbi:hypothetical protein KPL71_017486 [Citrus sinensis]|uniref:Uncharacterized protein n=1 Tax=Citrus sinensis TaxID=2711 RepID=A0ACB8JQU4_CITSI|nr:hypothetical protein KPL71_017486 [Citrus sinensis]
MSSKVNHGPFEGLGGLSWEGVVGFVSDSASSTIGVTGGGSVGLGLVGLGFCLGGAEVGCCLFKVAAYCASCQHLGQLIHVMLQNLGLPSCGSWLELGFALAPPIEPHLLGLAVSNETPLASSASIPASLCLETLLGDQAQPSSAVTTSLGPITRARAKKIKEAMQGFVQATLEEFNSNSICKRQMFKMGLKEEEPALVYLIRANELDQEGFSSAPFSVELLHDMGQVTHCQGDFNVIQSISKISSGHDQPQGAIDAFSLALLDCGLEDARDVASGPSRFKFLHAWLKHLDFLDVVLQSWVAPVEAEKDVAQKKKIEDASSEWISKPVTVALSVVDYFEGLLARVQELVHDLNCRNQGNNVVLKVDMAKAYDRMSWSFIIKMLRCFGFSKRWAKSSFYIRSLASASSQATVHYVTGFQQHQLPITYLGCPVFTRCLELSHFDDMVQKVRDKISGWANRLLSFDGKLVLICHVLSSMSFHIFHVLQYLEHIFAQFLWGDSEGRHQIHWCRWLKVYYPIEEGGLVQELSINASEGGLGYLASTPLYDSGTVGDKGKVENVLSTFIVEQILLVPFSSREPNLIHWDLASDGTPRLRTACELVHCSRPRDERVCELWLPLRRFIRLVSWTRPPPEVVKLTVDGCSRGNPGMVVLGSSARSSRHVLRKATSTTDFLAVPHVRC